jgi:hypothetical protein
MSKQEVGSDDSFLNNLEQLNNSSDRIRRALGCIGQAYLIGKATNELDKLNGNIIDPEIIAKRQKVEQSLFQIAELAAFIVSDVNIDEINTLTEQMSPMLTEGNNQPPAGELLPNDTRQPIVEDAKNNNEPHCPTSGRLSRTPQSKKQSSMRGQKKFDCEYYEAIISLEDVPVIENGDGNSPIDVTITSDETIMLNGNTIILNDDKLFVFNALMLHRDRPRTAREIRRLGFRPTEQQPSVINNAFHSAIKTLAEELDQAAGVEIIEIEGKTVNTRYIINPSVMLIEGRDANDKQVRGSKKN